MHRRRVAAQPGRDRPLGEPLDAEHPLGGIVAREAGPGRFTLAVSNNGKTASAKLRDGTPHGTGVGLGNVCERLDARFGKAAQCQYGPLEGGGYQVVMTLPLDRADA